MSTDRTLAHPVDMASPVADPERVTDLSHGHVRMLAVQSGGNPPQAVAGRPVHARSVLDRVALGEAVPGHRDLALPSNREIA